MPISLRAFRDVYFKAMLLAHNPTAKPISADRLKEYVGLEFEMFKVFIRWDIEAARYVYRYHQPAQPVSPRSPSTCANILSVRL